MSRYSVVFLAVLVLMAAALGVSGASSSCSYNTTGSGFNLPGFDLIQLPAASQDDCSAACCDTTACQAWVYAVTAPAAPNTPVNCTAGQSCCWLKYQRGDPQPANVSAITSGWVLTAPPSVFLYDASISFYVVGWDSSTHTLAQYCDLVLLDVAVTLSSIYSQWDASLIHHYLAVIPRTYTQPQLSGTAFYFNFMVMSPIYFATAIHPFFWVESFQQHVSEGYGFYPATYSQGGSEGEAGSFAGYGSFPGPALPGNPVYDAQVMLHYQITVHPTDNNMTLWRSQIQADIAANIAWLVNINYTTALLPFITIQSPAANTNPATFNVAVGQTYLLAFTLSADITTVTGPQWTPDVLGQAFSWLAHDDDDNQQGVPLAQINLWQPATSGIAVLVGPYPFSATNDIPTADDSTGTTGLQCQYGSDVDVQFLATFSAFTVGSPNTDQLIQLIQQDIAELLYIAAEADAGTEDYMSPAYTSVTAAAFLPYIEVVWPFLNTSVAGLPVIESYSATSGNTIVQPFATRSAYFYIRFNLLSNVSCILNGFTAQGIVQDMLDTYPFGGYINIVAVTTYSKLQLYTAPNPYLPPTARLVQLSGLPLCPIAVTAPSCAFVFNVPATSFSNNSQAINFTVSLAYPITVALDFTTKLQTDIVASLPLPTNVSAAVVLPYIVVLDVASTDMDETLVSFAIQGSVSKVGFGLSSFNLTAAFVASAQAGQLNMSNIAYWYGAVVPLQTPMTRLIVPAVPLQCQAANDTTITFLATFTSQTLSGPADATFIQNIAADITAQLAAALLNLSAPGTLITTSIYANLSATFSIVWPFMLSTGSNQSITSYTPSLKGYYAPFTAPQDWMYVRLNVFANATCVFGGLSAVEVSHALFDNIHSGTFVSNVSQLLVSTTSLQVDQSVLSSAALCGGSVNMSCPALPRQLGILANVSSSTGSLSGSAGYPAGSVAIAFYVVIGSISSYAEFAVEIQAGRCTQPGQYHRPDDGGAAAVRSGDRHQRHQHFWCRWQTTAAARRLARRCRLRAARLCVHSQLRLRCYLRVYAQPGFLSGGTTGHTADARIGCQRAGSGCVHQCCGHTHLVRQFGLV